MATVEARLDGTEFRALLRSVPAILTGHAPDPYGVARALQLRLGVTLLGRIQRAFVAKSRGGLGDDGIRWAPLKAKTVERRRKGPRGKKGKGQNKRPQKAGQIEILRDTGRLLNSLTPGQDKAGPEGVLETPPSRVVVGSAVPYASAHHRGVPRRRLPSRPFWPLDGSMPLPWGRALLEALRSGVAEAIKVVLAKGGRP